jgi:hypothetical protein
MTSKECFQSFRTPVSSLQPVIKEQLGASVQISRSNNKDAPIFFDRFAIGITGMVNPSRFVSPYRRIDDATVLKPKKGGVVRIIRVMWRQALCLLPRDPLSGVFDDPLPLSKTSRCEHAFSVDA